MDAPLGSGIGGGGFNCNVTGNLVARAAFSDPPPVDSAMSCSMKLSVPEYVALWSGAWERVMGGGTGVKIAEPTIQLLFSTIAMQIPLEPPPRCAASAMRAEKRLIVDGRIPTAIK